MTFYVQNGVPPISELPSINQDEKSIIPINQDEKDLIPRIKIRIPTSKRRSVRNLTLISIVYFLFFSSFWSLTNLESTMNAEGGMGTDSQAVIYLCSMISCFFPEFLIEKFGSKTIVVVCFFLSCPYIAANYYLRWDTLMVSSVIYGLVSGPLMTAISAYVDEMAIRYHSLSTESRETVEAFFFGFYMFWTEFTQIIGNGISFVVLEKRKHHDNNHTVVNECGIYFNPVAGNHSNDNLTPPTEHQRMILTTIYLVLGIASVILAFFLDALKNDMSHGRGCYSVVEKFLKAVKLLKNPHQLLLLPITIYLGMEGSFFSVDFAQAYIACSWGVHHVAFVSIFFGVGGCLMSLLVGPIVKCTSQFVMVLVAAVLNLAIFVLLFYYNPSPEVKYPFFVFTTVWGMTDAIWWSQMPALYGLLFPHDREAAYSNFYFWSFLGYLLCYGFANSLSVVVKLYSMIVFILVGITLFIVSHIMIRCSPRSGYTSIESSED